MTTKRLTTPSLAHSTALAPTKASRVGWSAGQARAHTMRKLVDDDASFEVAVPVGLSGVPEEHATAAVLAVRWLIDAQVKTRKDDEDKRTNGHEIGLDGAKRWSVGRVVLGREGRTYVIETTSVLSVGNDSVVLLASTPKVVLLKVSALLIEAISA